MTLLTLALAVAREPTFVLADFIGSTRSITV
jgi:hypothetical protein